MINHARTLLLNQARRNTHYSDIGHEYVPANFKPVALPATLNMVRQLLFGSAPDNYFLNYRCRELLAYIHTTELAEYIYKLDPRVTYWPETSKPFFEPTSKRVTITQTYGLPQTFTVIGNLQSFNSLGRAYQQYTLDLYKTIAQNGDTVLQLKLQTVGREKDVVVADVTSLDTPPILVLPHTNIKLRLNMRVPIIGESLLVSEQGVNIQAETPTPGTNINLLAEYPVIRRILTETDALMVIESYASTLGQIHTEDTEIDFEDTPGLVARWFIEAKATPEPILTSAIAGLEMIGEPASIELFGFDNKEPYLTFKNLWFDHPLPAYRLAGIVLALIYRTEELRG